MVSGPLHTSRVHAETVPAAAAPAGNLRLHPPRPAVQPAGWLERPHRADADRLCPAPAAAASGASAVPQTCAGTFTTWASVLASSQSSVSTAVRTQATPKSHRFHYKPPSCPVKFPPRSVKKTLIVRANRSCGWQKPFSQSQLDFLRATSATGNHSLLSPPDKMGHPELIIIVQGSRPAVKSDSPRSDSDRLLAFCVFRQGER